MGGFCIGTAGFPEGHVACKEGREVDWDHLKAKIDCGADFVLTQLFFDNARFFPLPRLSGQNGRDRADLPRHHSDSERAPNQAVHRPVRRRICPRLCWPAWKNMRDDDEACAEFGIEYATRQCEELLRAGVPGLHFYTLNKARSTLQVLRNLRLA